MKTYYILDKDGLRLYDYTKNAESVSQYRAEGYVVFSTLEQACAVIDENCQKHYCTPWVECSEDEYYDMLGVLPPLKQSDKGFVMSEFLTGTITAFYIDFGGRYFTANRNTKLTTLNDAFGEVELMFSNQHKF